MPLFTPVAPEEWGDITGTLSNQTDLNTALAGKLATGLAELLTNKNQPSGYAGLSAGSKLTGSQQVYGTSANTAAEGNDARLSDARVPLTHDILTTHSGFPGGTTNFLRADGSFAAPPGGGGGISLGLAINTALGYNSR